MQKRTSTTTRSRSGFTLIEVLVVLGIIVLLATMVGPKILGSRAKADIDVTETQIKSFKASLDLYQLHMRRFPSTEEGLDALVEEPSDEEDEEGESSKKSSWEGPYLEEIPEDPWGNDYQYEFEGKSPKIWSYGPDGEDGTEDDISNGKKKSSEDGEEVGEDDEEFEDE